MNDMENTQDNHRTIIQDNHQKKGVLPVTQDEENKPRRRRTQMYAGQYGEQKDDLTAHGAQEPRARQTAEVKPQSATSQGAYSPEDGVRPLAQTAIPLMPQSTEAQNQKRMTSPAQGTLPSQGMQPSPWPLPTQGTQSPQGTIPTQGTLPTRTYPAQGYGRPTQQQTANPAWNPQQPSGYRPTQGQQPWPMNGANGTNATPPYQTAPYSPRQQGSQGQPSPNQPSYGWHPSQTGGGNPPPPNQYGGFQPSPGRKPDGRRKKPGFSPKRLLKWGALVLGVALLVVLVRQVTENVQEQNQRNALIASVEAYEERYVPGVYVDGIDLGGMTREEAEAAVTAQANQQRDNWKVRLMLEGLLVQEITSEDLNMTVDVKEALDEAWKPGHTEETVDERRATMDALLETPYEGYSALPNSDSTVIDNILLSISTRAYISPVDAQIVFDPTNFSNPLSITPEVMGRYIDMTEVKQQLYQMVSSLESGEITLEMQEIAPKTTKAMLESSIQLRATAYTPISTTSTENRNKNIDVACSRINGIVLQPGETFSFNNTVGNRTKENGFYEAIEYAYGSERMGYGGGVCQVSTTIYLAAVKANMQIVKREPHSDAVGYTEYGKDATVNMDGRKIDFQFKNDTGSPIYIVTQTMKNNNYDKKHRVCVVSIYGASLGQGVTYDIVTETVEILAAPTEIEYRKDTTQTYATYVDQTYVYREAKDGCKVASYRVKYQNGKEVERTNLYTDTYKAKGAIIYVGTVERTEEYYP